MEKQDQDLDSRKVKPANSERPTAAEGRELTPQAAQRTEHTPGEWIYVIDDHGGHADPSGVVFLADEGPGRCVIALVEPQPQMAANARLIATAPKLLDAVKEYIHVHARAMRSREDAENAHASGDVPRCISKFKALVAKAEGR